MMDFAPNLETASKKKYTCIALTLQGVDLAVRLACGLPDDVDIFLPQTLSVGESALFAATLGAFAPAKLSIRRFASLPVLLSEIFSLYNGHIFVAATGIAVRVIAPLLKSKSCDPAVVVCDQRGQFCISLLSGHCGGGNELAQRIAATVGGTAVITTATDVENLPAADMLALKAGCRIVDWAEVKTINAAILRGEKIAVYDPLAVLQLAAPFVAVAQMPQGPQPAVAAHWQKLPPRPGLLRLAVPVLYAGIGCRLGALSGDILAALWQSLAQAGLEPLALAALASVEEKRAEAGLVEAAGSLKLPLEFFSAAHLATMPVKNPSPAASRRFGQDNLCVCEGAALAAAWLPEHHACLLAEKAKCGNVTVAVSIRVCF